MPMAMYCETAVAIPTPIAPIWNTHTKIRLRNTLARPESVRKIKGFLESPLERRMLAAWLYTMDAGMPTKYALI